jgi:hypothetical protein
MYHIQTKFVHLRATDFWKISKVRPFGGLYLGHFLVSSKMLLEGYQSEEEFYR